MSKQVDERVVEMRFDNQQFESGVKTTMSTIDKLKQSLKFTDASKGLDNLNTAAKKLNFSEASDGTKTLTTKMSTLGVIGFSVISKITGAVIDLGVQAIKAASSFGGLQSAMAGFQEYETQINAVQTILANTSSKGTTLDQVNAALDELNTYADKTIYNFTQMTRNIGTFTAAGVDLETSVAAIQGIANLAAVSGSTSQQASTAMYQLSQALAAGRVSLMDWNSVVNAGMGGEVFQNALKRTARVMGKDVDAAIEKYGSFRESLTQGEWLTTDVLTETLRQFTMAAEEGSEEWENFKASLKEKGYTDEQAEGILKMANTATDAATKVKTFTQLIDTLKEAAQSGWTQTWEIIIGDFEEAKEFFTYLSDFFSEIIGNKADKRNEVLEEAFTSNWDKLQKKLEETGVSSEQFNDAVSKALEKHGYNVDEVTEKYGSLEEAFRSGKISSDILLEALNSTNDSFVDLSGVTAGLARDDGLNGYVDDVAIVQEALKDLGYDLGTFGEQANGVDGIFGAVTESAVRNFQEMNGLEVTGIIDQATLDKIQELRNKTDEAKTSWEEYVEDLDKLGGRELLIESIKNLLESLKSIMDSIGEGWKSVFPISVEQKAGAIYDVLDGIHTITENFKNFITDNSDSIARFFSGIFSVFGIGADLIGAAWDAIKPIFGSLGDVEINFLDAAAAVGDWLTNLRQSIEDSEIFSKVIEPIAGFIKSIVDGIINFGTNLKDNFHFPDITAFVDGVKEVFGAFKEKLNLPNIDKILSFFQGIAGVIGAIGAPVGIFLTDTLQSFADFVNSIFDPEFDIKSAFDTLVTKVKYGFDSFIIGVKTIFEFAWNELFGEGSFGSFAENFETIKNTLVDKISGFAGPIIDAAKSIWEKIKEFFTGFNIFEPITKAFADDGTKETNIEAAVTNTLGISSTNADGVPTFLDSIIGFFSKIGEGIGGIVDTIGFIFDAIVEPFNKNNQVMQGFSIFWEGLVTLVSGIASALGTLFSGIGDILKDADFDKLMEMFKTGGQLYGAFVILKSIRDVTKSFGKAGDMFDEIGEFFKTLSEKEEFKFKESFTTKLLKAAASVILIATAMKIFASAAEDFAQMDVGDLIKAGVVMAVIMGMISKFSKSSKDTSFGVSSGIGIIAIAAAMKVFASAAKDFAEIEWSDLAKAAIAIGGLMISLNFFNKSTQSKGGLSTGLGMIALAAAMKIFASAAKDFAELSWGDLAKGAVAIGGLMLSLSIFNKSTPGKGGVSSGVGIIALAAAMKIFASAAKDFAEMDWSGIGKSVVGMGSIMILLTIFSAIVGKAKGLVSAGIGVILVAAAMKVMASAVKDFADTEWGDIGKAITAMGSLVGLFAAIEFVQKYAGKAFSSIIMIALVMAEMYALSYVVKQFSDVEWGDLGKAVAAMGSIELLVAGASAIGKLGGGIVAAISGLLSIIIFIGVLGAVMAGLGALQKKFSQIEGWIETGGDILEAIGTGIGKFVGGIYAGLGEAVTNSLPAIGQNLSDFMTNAQGFIDGAKQIDASVVEGVTALCDVIGQIVGANIIDKLTGWAVGGSNFETFGFNLSSLGRAICDYATSIESLTPEAIQKIKDSAGAAEGLATLANHIPPSGGVLQTFGGEHDFGAFALNIGLFGMALQSYAAAIRPITDDDMEKIKATADVGQALADLAATIPASGGWLQKFTGEHDFAAFSLNITQFGMALQSYAAAVRPIADDDIEKIKASAEAGKGLADLADTIPESGGYLQKFTGEHDFAKFSLNIVQFGKALSSYAEAIRSVTSDDIEKIKASADVGTALANLADTIPESGGYLQKFTGEHDFAKFSLNIQQFGLAIAMYALAIRSITDDDIEKIKTTADVGQALADLANTIPASGGWLQTFTGEHDFAKFGTNIADFGSAIQSYATSIADVSPEDIQKIKDSATIGDTFAELAASLGKEGGVVGFFTGDSAFGTFGENIKKIGEGIAGYATAIDETNLAKASLSVSMLSDLVDVINKYTNKNVDNLTENIGKIKSAASEFATQVGSINDENLGTAVDNIQDLKDMITNLGDFDDSGVETFKTVLTNLAGEAVVNFANGFSSSAASTVITDAVKSMIGFVDAELINSLPAFEFKGSALVEKLSDGISTGGETTITSIGTVLTNVLEVISFQYGAFEVAGSMLILCMSTGIANASGIASSAANEVASSCVSKISAWESNFYNLGSYLVSGFALGIGDFTWKAEAKARAMANAAYEAAKNALDINSPSKVFRKLAYSIPEGMAAGIDKMAYLVENSSTAMADTAIEGTQYALSNLGFMLGSDIDDVQPTIRPVLDLSDVEYGARTIDSMFGAANAGTISAMMNANIQNGSTNRLLSAIEDLRADLGNVGGSTVYNVNGITYDDGTNVSNAVADLVRAARIERRV